MNKIYSKIWSKTSGTWVVASEFAKRNGKQSVTTRLAAVSLRAAWLLGVAIGCGGVSARTLAAAAHITTVPANTAGIDRATRAIDANTYGNGSHILADVRRFLRTHHKTKDAVIDGIPFVALSNAPDQSHVVAPDDHLSMPGPPLLPNAPPAVVNNPVELGTNSTAFGANSTAAADESTAYGYNSYAGDTDSTALGANANASGIGAAAIGSGASTGSDYATALGFSASAIGIRSVALGAGAQTTGNSGVAIGGVALDANDLPTVYDDQGNPRATTASANATAVGASAVAKASFSTALGVGTFASGLGASAIGVFSAAHGDYSTAVGTSSAAGGDSSTAVGTSSAAGGDSSTAVGNSSRASGESSTALGTQSAAAGSAAIALGQYALASGDGSTALGMYTSAEGENSIAIGGLAASGGWILGEKNADGNYSLVKSTALKAIAIGYISRAFSEDNVVVGGLAHAMGENSMAMGNGAGVGGIGFDLADGILYGMSPFANGVALGAHSSVMADNAVALGANSLADRENTVSVGSEGSERQITNVAAGTAGTDAVNQAQLLGALNTLGGGAAFDAKGGLTLPTFTMLGGTYHSVSDVFGALNGAFNGVRVDILALQNLTAGAVQNGQVAVGGNEAAKVTPDTRALAVGANAVAAGDHGTAVGDDSYAAGPKDTALGAHAIVGADGSTAVGANSSIASAATNAVAIGESATVTAASGTAIGQGASATAAGAVALGQGSVANRANTVSVGAAGNQRQITNVAAGTQASDAANTEQVTQALATAKTYADAGDRVTLNSAKTYTDQKVSGDLRTLRNEVNDQFHTVNRRLDQVGAMGAAMSQMAFSTQGIGTPNRLGVGIGGYGSRSALSVGYSRSLSPRANLTFGGAVSNGGEASAGIGLGLGW